MQSAGAWHIALLEPRASFFSLDEHDLWESRPARLLQSRGYEAYYPGIPRKTHVKHRVPRTTMEPMFRGYIFVRLATALGWEALRTTPGVQLGRSLLYDRATERLSTIEDEAVWAIVAVEEKLREQMLNPPPRKLPYHIGDRVRVVEGPFAGLLAKIAALDSEARIAVLLELSGWKVFTRADQLEPVREPKRAAS